MTRIAFVTGVSSGIGLGLTRAYLECGVRVYGLSRRKPELAESSGLVFGDADLADLDALPRAVKGLLAETAQLDLVVLNAGVLGRIDDLGETSVEEMKQVFQVNLWANKVILDTLFKLEIPVTQVVAISSGAAITPQRGWNAYAISKAGLNMLIGLYAAERPETHFCALAPGIVDTAMQDQVAELPQDGRFPSLETLRMAKGSPMMPKPDEVAPRLIEAMEKARKYPSGSFLDLNSMVKRTW
jgi:benzil reductase ((S)-benzoin forming)